MLIWKIEVFHKACVWAATKSPSPTECRADWASMTLRHRQHRKDELGWRQSYDANHRRPRKSPKGRCVMFGIFQIMEKSWAISWSWLFTSAWGVIRSHRTVFWALKHKRWHGALRLSIWSVVCYSQILVSGFPTYIFITPPLWLHSWTSSFIDPWSAEDTWRVLG